MLILGLEAGLDGGTAALCADGAVIDEESGESRVSKSEDLLMIVDDLLKRNNLRKNQIGHIVVSDHPGSLTGSRIGLATVKGISDSLEKPYSVLPVLDAMAILSRTNQPIIAVLKIKNGIFFRKFRFQKGHITATGEVRRVADEMEFIQILGAADNRELSVVFHESAESVQKILFETDTDMNGLSFLTIKGTYAAIIAKAVSYASDNIVDK